MRLIDADELKKDMIEYGWKHPDSTVTEYVNDFPKVAAYTADDMINMFCNLIRNIEKHTFKPKDSFYPYIKHVDMLWVNKCIQEEIDRLKENTNGKAD